MAGLLANKTCLVTGAGRGIGSSVALAFAKENATLALVARTEDQLKEVAKQCKQVGAASVSTHSVDLTDFSSREKLVAELLKEYGTINVLVNNAGMGAYPGDPLNGDMAEFEKMLHLNLHAPMHLTRLVAPSMVEAKRGLIVNMGSVAGVEPMQGACAYAASKAGLRNWSLSCYQNLRKHGIKVILVNPGAVNTPMQDRNTGASNRDLMIQPEDIAEAVMLAVRTKQSCCPQEMTIRPTEPAF